MTNRDVALLAFKLLGLWLVANAAIGVAGLFWLPYAKHIGQPDEQDAQQKAPAIDPEEFF